MKKCATIDCNVFVGEGHVLCPTCVDKKIKTSGLVELPNQSMAIKYPKYYKSTQGMTEVDVYAVLKLFDIQDSSGAIHHATKKLLLSGVRTGGKTKHQDITEARDTLTRWLELNKET